MAEENERINKIIGVIQKAAQGDLSVQAGISDKNDEYDSLAMGINMMIDDLRVNIKKEQATNEELKSKMADLEKQQTIMIGREKRIIELKNEVNALSKELGREGKYLGDNSMDKRTKKLMNGRTEERKD